MYVSQRCRNPVLLHSPVRLAPAKYVWFNPCPDPRRGSRQCSLRVSPTLPCPGRSGDMAWRRVPCLHLSAETPAGRFPPYGPARPTGSPGRCPGVRLTRRTTALRWHRTPPALAGIPPLCRKSANLAVCVRDARLLGVSPARRGAPMHAHGPAPAADSVNIGLEIQSDNRNRTFPAPAPRRNPGLPRVCRNRPADSRVIIGVFLWEPLNDSFRITRDLTSR